jgi:carbonic anhydrase/acetyltransferase-like protein (isoleucine patch superfamily)
MSAAMPSDIENSSMGNLENQLETFLRKKPSLGKEVYIASGAVVSGDVTLGDFCSVWHNAVLRGDINRIVVGHHTNIQDTAVMHLADEFSCTIGDYTTVGHGAILHACSVGNEVLVGMRATILDGVEIGDQCIIGAASLVPQGMRVPSGSLVWGVPGRIIRALSPEERAELKGLAEKYVRLAAFYLHKL